jgi:hypothetical protein
MILLIIHGDPLTQHPMSPRPWRKIIVSLGYVVSETRDAGLAHLPDFVDRIPVWRRPTIGRQGGAAKFSKMGGSPARFCRSDSSMETTNYRPAGVRPSLASWYVYFCFFVEIMRESTIEAWVCTFTSTTAHNQLNSAGTCDYARHRWRWARRWMDASAAEATTEASVSRVPWNILQPAERGLQCQHARCSCSSGAA